MRHSYVYVLFLASQSLAASVGDAKESAADQIIPAGILHLPMVPIPPNQQDTSVDLSKRQVQGDLDVYRYSGATVSFGIPLEIGTPPQTVIVEPDTGSELFWVPNVRAGKVREEPASTYFDRARSTSIQDLDEQYGASYGSSESLRWNVTEDVVFMRGTSLGKILFGVVDPERPGNVMRRNVGTLGLLEIQSSGFAKDHIVQKMLENKLIASRSISMNVDEQGKGAITFGGYDTKKFSGPLEKFPFSSSYSWPDHFVVNMKSLSLSDTSGTTAIQFNDSQGLTIGLDSGAPAISIQKAAFNKLQAKLGDTDTQDVGRVLTANCSLLQDANITFIMNDKLSITTSLKDLELDIPHLKTGGKCPVAIQAHNGNLPADIWVGGPFLRRAYVIFDSAGRNIYVARSGNCGSNLVVINGSIPIGVVGDCAEQQLVPFSTPPDAPAD